MKNLIGEWKFIRNINDKYANTRRRAIGTLTITNAEWLEQGTMDNQPFFQNYKLNFSDSFTVLFPDDRLFYTINNIMKSQEVYHLCGNDSYNGYWDFNTDKLQLNWTVQGKRKDYTMQTTYTKITNDT